MHYNVKQFINGKKTESSSSVTTPIYNPSLGQIIGEVHHASQAEIQAAIDSAKKAYPTWALTSPAKRARVLFQYKELIEKNMDVLAELLSQENGKLLNDSKGSIVRGLEIVEFACGIPNLLKGEFSENVGTDIDSYTLRQPLGVCVGITPFNFPAMVPLWMAVMAIACGNTFILKPSEKDPSCSIYLASLFKEAGLPDGVFNVLHGDKIVVDHLISHPDIAAVSFVGSTPIAQYIYQTASMHNKRVQAFGGAKNHAVVMPDANLEQVADALVSAAYGTAGERCMAISVVVAVGDETANLLVEKLKTRVLSLRIGASTDSDVDLGPLITKEHLEHVKSYVTAGIEEGATLVVDGREQGNHLPGFFLGACLFDNVNSDMRIYRDEIFGPVLCIVRVKNFETALKLINENPYGNGTAIFTHEGGIARTFAAKTNIGMVGINIPIPVPVAYHSFGGSKDSMFGDIGMYGKEGVRFFTKLKKVTARWPLESKLDAEFILPGTR